MIHATVSSPQPAAVLTPYLFTVVQYQQLDEIGVFWSDRVELIDGQIVWKVRNSPQHNAAVGRLRLHLEPQLPGSHYFREQVDVALTESQPQPDGAVVLGENGDAYSDHHPGPGDVALLVEVSDSSFDADRTTKLRIYAFDGIAVYWIINIPERRLEVYTQPGGPDDPTYHNSVLLAETDSVTVTIGTTIIGPIAVVDLLPRA